MTDVILENISQVAIVILGLSAMVLVSRKCKWGFVVGLFSQPFWIYTTLYNKQPGLFILSVIYFFIWIYGIYKWFGVKGEI